MDLVKEDTQFKQFKSMKLVYFYHINNEYILKYTYLHLNNQKKSIFKKKLKSSKTYFIYTRDKSFMYLQMSLSFSVISIIPH